MFSFLRRRWLPATATIMAATLAVGGFVSSGAASASEPSATVTASTPFSDGTGSYSVTYTVMRDCAGTISGSGVVSNLPGPQVATYHFFYVSTGNTQHISIDAKGRFSFSLSSSYPVNETISPSWGIGLGQNRLPSDDTDYSLGGFFTLPGLTDCGGGGTTTTTSTSTTSTTMGSTTTTVPSTTSTTQPPAPPASTTTTVVQPPPSSTSTTGPPTTSTTQPAPPSGVSTTRESGQPPNRIGTAIAVSKSDYAAGNAQSVVVARNDVYADALTGGPLAAAKQGPLLLTEPSKLNSATAAEMQRVLPAGGTVYLLGGNAALAPNVANAIQALGYKVVRVSGPTRFATAVAVARQLGNPKVDFLATGLNFPDALSAGPAAVAQQAAILLSNGSSQSAVTAAYLASSQPATVYAVGGEACQADPQAICVADTDRFGTAVAVAQKFFPNPSTIGVATGLDFPDALAADPALGLEGSPIILVNPNVPLPANTLSYLSSTKSVRNIQVFGGSAAVSQSVVQQVLSALS